MTLSSSRAAVTWLSLLAAGAVSPASARDIVPDFDGVPPALESGCPWDCSVPQDNGVNVNDLLGLLGQYDPGAPFDCDGGSCDFDGNGCVDVVDLLKLLGHWNEVCPEPVLFYADPTEFFDAILATTKIEKFVWDFNPHDEQSIIAGLNNPLDIFTHGQNENDPWTDAAGGNLWPPQVDNVQFSSNMTPPEPLTPEFLSGLAFIHPGSCRIDNNALVASFAEDSFDIISGPPAGDNHTAFALELAATSFVGPAQTVVHVTVYDKQDLELGTFEIPVFGKAFLGIITKGNEITIGRIDIWDPSGLFEGVSSITSFRNACGPGSGPCDQPDGTPGCDIPDCCKRICALDPFCCDTGWDQICADEADLFPQCNPFGCSSDPANGPCCVADGTPFCEIADCCRSVCAIDPFCCDISWDGICAGEAATFPQCLCNNPSGCTNDPANGPCCVADGTPFCENVDCCRRVCAIDPFCCTTAWDQLCADEAATFRQCGCVAPSIMPPNSHTNQDGHSNQEANLDSHTNQGAHTNQDFHTNQDPHTNQD